MSHAYPLGETLDDALKPDARAARTRGQAEEIAEGFNVDALVTDWLTLTAEDVTALMQEADDEAVAAHGHLQRYEDHQGHPVLAVTWWRLVSAKATVTKLRPEAEPEPDPEPETDHTDDLYFRFGRTKPRRTKKDDPNQMDLFGQSESED